jgi:hypothetical protein
MYEMKNKFLVSPKKKKTTKRSTGRKAESRHLSEGRRGGRHSDEGALRGWKDEFAILHEGRVECRIGRERPLSGHRIDQLVRGIQTLGR